MSSSPRFWQKLGLGKQNKSSTSIDKQDKASIHSVQSTNSLNDETHGKHLKRFSSISLRYKASTPNFRHSKNTPPDIVPLKKSHTNTDHTRYSIPDNSDELYFDDNKSIMEESNISYIKGRHMIDSNANKKEKYSFSSPRRPSTESMYSYHSNSKSPRLSTSQPPARQPSQRESNAISSPPSKLLPRLKPSRSNQSLKSTSTNTSQSGRPSTEQPSQPLKQSKTTRLRKPSPATHIPRSDSNASIISHTNNNKNKQRFEKIVHSTHNSSDENESCGSQKQLTRSSSNGSSITERRRTSYSNKRLKYPTTLEDTYFMIDSLRDDLEKEKSAARALQGQKEAIARDLDYFCEQADEISLERDEYKRKYEEEKAKNEQSVSINRSQTGMDSSQLKIQLEDVQQQLADNQYMYYNNIQSKNDEINKLKADLRQSQIQLQVLRKTMEQMLKADGREVFYEDDFEYKLTKKKSFYENDDNRCLLLQTGYQPDHLSASSLSSKGSNTNKPTTNPPSPTPCYLPSEDDSPYGFLNDPFVMESDTQQRFSLAKRKSEDFTKKLELSRRRKDQIEEMLGEVDSQLSRVKQKIRTPSACEK